MKKVLLVLMLICLAAFNVDAADKVSIFGVPNSSGVPPMKVDTDRMITIATDAGLIQSYEYATTDDTITAAECGKTFIMAPVNANVIMSLPDADVGCELTFVQSAGNAAGTKKFIINPQDTDLLRGVVNTTAGSTFAVGDSAITPGATGDSITVFCGVDTYWDVVERTGTWVDNN